MSKKWITVEREYGSGGTEIGRKVAELAGVPFYGREILERVSELSGVGIDEKGLSGHHFPGSAPVG